jgi:hypothetical protein
MTDEQPPKNTLWQYALRFRLEELFSESKSVVFQLAQSQVRPTMGLERLCLVAAVCHHSWDGNSTGWTENPD